MRFSELKSTTRCIQRTDDEKENSHKDLRESFMNEEVFLAYFNGLLIYIKPVPSSTTQRSQCQTNLEKFMRKPLNIFEKYADFKYTAINILYSQFIRNEKKFYSPFWKFCLSFLQNVTENFTKDCSNSSESKEI